MKPPLTTRRPLLTLVVLALAVASFSQTAATQTPAEIAALKQLGCKGHVFWLSAKRTTATQNGETKDITWVVGGQIWSYRLDGTGVAKPQIIVQKAWCVAVSADGRQIAYTVAASDGAAVDLYVAGIDGSNPRKITSNPMPYVACLKGDLSGNRMVFTSRSRLSRWDRWGTSNIWVADFSGTIRHHVTHAGYCLHAQ